MNTLKTIISKLTKIALILILTVALSIQIVPPTFAQSTIDIATLTANDPNSQINLRAEPNISARRLGYGLPGDQVKILDLAKGSDNQTRFPWIKVQFIQSGAIGWIRGDFVSTSLTILIANDPNSRINLRAQPSIASPKLGYGLPGDHVIVLACETGPDRDRTPWIKVQFLESEAIGWIRGDFFLVPLTYC